MIECVRGLFGFVAQIHLNGVAVIRPDIFPVLIQSETLFIAVPDDLEYIPGTDGFAVSATGSNQGIYRYPSGFIQLDSDALRIVAEHVAEKLAESGFSIAHLRVNVKSRSPNDTCFYGF